MFEAALAVLVLLIVAPAAALVVFTLQAARRPRVLCLMYHRLAPRRTWERARGTERLFCLPTERFDEQMAHLKAAGYTFVTPAEVAAHAEGRASLPDRSVLISFDDGCRSVLEQAAPILRKHGGRATVFVTTDPASHVFSLGDETQRRLSDDELRTADADVLHVASHAVTHRPLRGLAEAELRAELHGSKQELERVLGREVCYLAIPGNWYDRKVMQVAREAGYRAVWCSNPATTGVGASRFGLPRIHIEGQLDPAGFVAAISPWGIAKRRLFSWLKWAPGRLLGPRLWSPLRRLLMKGVPGGYLSLRRVALAALVLLAGVAAIVLGLLGRS